MDDVRGICFVLPSRQSRDVARNVSTSSQITTAPLCGVFQTTLFDVFKSSTISNIAIAYSITLFILIRHQNAIKDRTHLLHASLYGLTRNLTQNLLFPILMFAGNSRNLMLSIEHFLYLVFSFNLQQQKSNALYREKDLSDLQTKSTTVEI